MRKFSGGVYFEHRANFNLMREDDVANRHPCKFLACFDTKNSVDDVCWWNLLYEICGDNLLKELPAVLESVMEFA